MLKHEEETTVDDGFDEVSVLRMVIVRVMCLITIPLAIVATIFRRFYRVFMWSDRRLLRWFFLQDVTNYFIDNTCTEYSEEALSKIKGLEIRVIFKDQDDAE